MQNNQHIIDETEKIVNKILEANIVDGKVEFNKIKSNVREKVGKYLYRETKCRPMILTVIQEV